MVVELGVTVIVEPEPIEFVPHKLSYQFHTAPVPNWPPEILKVVELPVQKLFDVDCIPVGAMEPSLV